MQQEQTFLENAILGRLLISKTSTIRDVIERLKPTDFSDHRNRIIYETIIELTDSGVGADIVTVSDALIKKDLIYSTKTGQGISRAYLVELQEDIYSELDIERYIDPLIERNVRMKLHMKLRLQEDAMAVPADELRQILQNAHSTLEQLKTGSNSLVGSSSYADLRQSNIKSYLETPKVGTGFKTIDRHLAYGFAPTMVSTVSADPGVGKSTFKSNCIRNLCELGFGVFNVNTEQSMLVEQNRFDSMMLQIPLTEIIRMKYWSKDDSRFQRISENAAYIQKNWNYWMIANPEMTVDLLDRFIGQILEKGKLHVVFCDLWDRFTDIDMDSAANVLKKLKQTDKVAKNNGVHICVLAQQKQEGGKRVGDRYPRTNKIKWGSTFYEVSRLILLLYREALYKKDVPNNTMDVIIGKQNDGNAGDFFKHTLAFDPEYLLLFDERDEPQEDRQAGLSLDEIPPQTNDDVGPANTISFDDLI